MCALYIPLNSTDSHVGARTGLCRFAFVFICISTFRGIVSFAKGGGNLVSTLRKSYSLSDLSEPDVPQSQDEVSSIVTCRCRIRPDDG